MTKESELVWVARKRAYQAEKKINYKQPQPCMQDPLKALDASYSIIEKSSDSHKDRNSTSKPLEQAFVDPLNQLAATANEVPFSLSKMVADVSLKEKVFFFFENKQNKNKK